MQYCQCVKSEYRFRHVADCWSSHVFDILKLLASLPMQCDAILKHGVFDSILMDQSRSVAENVFAWLSTTDYGTFTDKQGSGFDIGFVYKGIPIKFQGSHTEDEFKDWKKALASGNARQFTESEAMQIVQRNASKTIVDAWLNCIKVTSPATQTGLIGGIDGPDDSSTIVIFVRYLPTSISDFPPLVTTNGFQISGGRTQYPLIAGQEIPLAGTRILVSREGREAVTVLINTTKGSIQATAPATGLEARDIKLVVRRSEEHPYFNRYDIKIDVASQNLMQYIASVKYRFYFDNLPSNEPVVPSPWNTSPNQVVSTNRGNSFTETFSEGAGEQRRTRVLKMVIADIELDDNRRLTYNWEPPTFLAELMSKQVEILTNSLMENTKDIAKRAIIDYEESQRVGNG